MVLYYQYCIRKNVRKVQHFFAYVGNLADILGIVSFILLLIQGSQIRNLKNNVKVKNKTEQYKKNQSRISSDISTYITIIKEKKFSDKENLRSTLNGLFGELEYYQEIESINDIKKLLLNAKTSMINDDMDGLVLNLTKLHNVCERKVDDWL